MRRIAFALAAASVVLLPLPVGAATPHNNRASAAGLSIPVPSGWAWRTTTNPSGLVVAKNKVDLSALAPSDGVLAARVSRGARESVSSVLAGLSQSNLVGSVSSASLKLAGKPAVSVQYNVKINGLIETAEIVVVSLGGGAACVFTLEAPQSRWNAAASPLRTALAGVHIDVAAVRRLR